MPPPAVADTGFAVPASAPAPLLSSLHEQTYYGGLYQKLVLVR